MAVTDQQKLDFLLKKIGYTKTKTGSVVGTGAISGTPKQPFAEAIPSPLVVANSSLWNEADSIPTTPPGADTTQVKVYLAATSGLRMTADATSSGQRAYIAYSTYGNTSSTRLTNWIDTQFGASYIIKVYRGDPNSGGVNLSAAGSGQNDGWFFDYSAGVLNFNDSNVPTGVTDTNIYIVGYRYIGQTGAPTSGISTFSYLDLTVERNLDVGVQGGISTFRNNIDLNANLDVSGSSTFAGNIDANGDLDVDGHTNLDNVSVAGVTTFSNTVHIGTGTTIESNGQATFTGITTFHKNIKLPNGSGGDSTIGRIQLGTGPGIMELYHYNNNNYFTFTRNQFIRGDANGRTIHIQPKISQNGIEIIPNGAVELYHSGTKRLETSSVGVSIPQDLDVDGHTNLDNISVAGVSTFTGDATFSGSVSIGGTLTYEDVTNVDSVGLLTARSGIRVTGGVIEALAGENKIPSLYANYSDLPSAGSYHGMFAHVHATGRGYFAHGGAWYELVNADLTGRVGTGTESYFIDRLVSTSTTATSLNVVGVSTFGGALDINNNVVIDGNIDLNGDLDVDGHTNLDNINITGVTTTTNHIDIDADDKALRIGDGQDIQIFHNTVTGSGRFANSSYIENNTGNLFIRGIVGTIIGSTSGEIYAQFLKDDKCELRFDNNIKFVTTNTGVTVTGTVVADGADINGDLDVDGHTNLDNVSVAGVTTFAGAIDANGDLDVDGHTNLDNISIAGVSTFAGAIDLNADLDVDGHTNLDNVNIAGVTSCANSIHLNQAVPEIKFNSTTHENDFRLINYQGNFLIQDEDALANRFEIASNGTASFLNIVNANGGLQVTQNATFNNDIDVDGHTELDNVNIVGVTTAAGHVLPSADVTYDLGSSSKQWRNLYADNIVSAPGNGFIGPDLTVRNFKATGISTFVGNARFNSTIAVHDGTTGSNGQYLKSVGTGVTWASFPTLRTRDTIVASAGQTNFTFTYTVNFIDVFVNGIKLTDSEFTATNGTSVVLAVGCFVGDIVELVSYNTVSTGAGGGGGTLNNLVEDTSPQLGANLDLFNKTITGTGGINITGVVTATTFIGDGSGLTGITASGTGVVIRNNNNTVGTAGTINFGDDLSVTPIVAGIVTVGIDTSQINLNKLNVSGISTFNGNVDINADLDVDGHTNLDNVSVAGVVTATTFVGAVTGNVTGNATGLSGTPNISVGTISGSTGTFSGTIDANGDLDVDGHTELDNVNIAGVVTATTFKGALEATSGSFSSNIDANGDLDVDGHTNLDNLSVAGVSTFSGNLHVGIGATVGIGSTAYVHKIAFKEAGSVNSTLSAALGVDGSSLTFVGGGVQNGFWGNAGLRIGGNGSSALTGPESGCSLHVVSTDNTKVLFHGAANAQIELRSTTGNGVENIFRSNKALDFVTGTGAYSNVFRVGETEGSTFFHTLNFRASDGGTATTTIDAISGIVTATKFVGDGSGLTNITASGSGVVVKHDGSTVGTAGTINFSTNLDVSAISAGIVTITATDTQLSTEEVQDIVGAMFSGNTETNITATYQDSDGTIDLIATGSYSNSDVDSHLNVSGASSGQILSWNGSDYAWVADQTGGGGGTNVGITTNLSGTFTASAGSPSTINTFAYHDNDKVVEYTVYIKNGSNFQSQKLLAMRDGTTIHSTQFAVMFSSSLLVQCDATISSGNILLRATPETGVSGSTTYKVKREVM